MTPNSNGVPNNLLASAISKNETSDVAATTATTSISSATNTHTDQNSSRHMIPANQGSIHSQS